KGLDAIVGEPWDFVITVCDNANESCPIFPGDAERVHWSFEDPAAAHGSEGERLRVFRRVRDELLGRLRLFILAQHLGQGAQTVIMKVCAATPSVCDTTGARYLSQLVRSPRNLSRPATIGATVKPNRRI